MPSEPLDLHGWGSPAEEGERAGLLEDQDDLPSPLAPLSRQASAGSNEDMELGRFSVHRREGEGYSGLEPLAPARSKGLQDLNLLIPKGQVSLNSLIPF